MLSRAGLALLSIVAYLLLAGCRRPAPAPVNYDMGDKVTVGPLTYSVIDSSWKGELGEGYKIRTPTQRFLLLMVSIANNGGNEISVPLLQLAGPNGEMFPELADGDGVNQWIGILRTMSPGQTLQGRLVFDVPLTSYRLRLVDGGDPGFEKYAWVQIPLKLDADTPLFNPLPENTFK